MQNAVTVAVVQLSSQGDVQANLCRVSVWVAEAAARGATLVVLPENFAFFGEESQKSEVAEDLDSSVGPVTRALCELAQKHGVWIVGGGFPERAADPARPFNTAFVVNPVGHISARYRKIHLFDVDLDGETRYRESTSTSAGHTPVVTDVAGVRLGLSVCYDVRFPELYRALIDRGAEAFVVPAAFTLQTGKDHWHALLRARAIESQAYVLAAAQWGKHPRGRQTYGKSCIIDPWGDIIAQASEGEGIAVGVLDPARLQRVRATLPALTHRKL